VYCHLVRVRTKATEFSLIVIFVFVDRLFCPWGWRAVGISSVSPVIELSYFLFYLLLCRCLSVNNLWMCCG